MLEIENVLQIKPHIFDNLAAHWHKTTNGELALLGPQGQMLKSYNGAGEKYQDAITVSAAKGVQLKPQTEAIIAPLILQDELKGHLLSCKTSPNYLPMLNWVAEVFLEHLEREQALQGMTDELISAWNQLDLVYHITQTLAQETDLRETLESILDQVIKVMKVETGFILFTQAEQIQCVVVGSQALKPLICEQDLLQKLVKENQLILFDNYNDLQHFWPQAPLDSTNFIANTIFTRGRIPAAVGLLNNSATRKFTAGDVKLITAISEQIGAIIDNYNLNLEVIAQERVYRELEIAAEIQESLLPKTIPEIKGLSIDVDIFPAFEVGGDFYDFIDTGDDHLTIVIGDVAGKGVPAAMFTSMVRTVLRIEALHNQEPHIILKRVNEVLHSDLWQAELFITAFVATFDTRNKVLMYANAGHTPGIIYHAQSKTSRLLKATSLPIGIMGYDYRTTQYVHLSADDTLVLYSDGISEAQNANDETYGIQRIQHLVHQHADKSPAILRQIILRDMEEFGQTDTLTDDMTLVVAKFSLEDTRQPIVKDYDILETISFEYKADTVHLADISKKVTSACRSLKNLPPPPKGDDFVYLVELAVSEICTNTMKHAYAGKKGLLKGVISVTSIGIQIDIYDKGEGFNPDDVPPPISDPMDPAEGGYGLHIVRQIMDIAEYEADENQGNHWKLVKYIPT